MNRRNFLSYNFLSCLTPIFLPWKLSQRLAPTIEDVPIRKLLDYGVHYGACHNLLLTRHRLLVSMYGQLEDVLITEDRFVLNNQLTVMAMRQLELETVRCKILPCRRFWSSDPNVLIERYS